MSMVISTVRDATGAGRPLLSFGPDRHLLAAVESSDHQIPLPNGRAFFFGDVYYVRDGGRCVTLAPHDHAALVQLLCEKRPDEIQAALEGQYVCLLVDEVNRRAHVFADRFARRPCFVLEHGGEVVIAEELDRLFERCPPRYDQVMVAHLLSTYGWFTPQGRTIYSNVRELRIGEVITITEAGVACTQAPFSPRVIEEYDESRLDEYYALLRQAILSRANPAGPTWVSASGGWDTSMILSVLASEFDARNIRMITARLRSFGTAGRVFNPYEIDKVRRLASHFGLRSEIVDLKFDEAEEDYWLSAARYCRGRHTYAFCSTLFQPLADWLHREVGPGAVVLNGEGSDSFHNFGFSQYKTLFHTSPGFCEYADKMNCYLFGPTFLRKVLDGRHEEDRVFELLVGATRGRVRGEWPTGAERIAGFLYPFFYGSAHDSPRIPFAEGARNPLLTGRGAAELRRFPFGTYAPWVAEVVRPDNLYSVLTHLYHHFHCQGATVAAHKHAMARAGHRLRLPFHDSCLVDFLAVMPESWGRGLDINCAKYPLKEIARRKRELNFPYAQLAGGPHDYLSDTVPGYSLYDDIVHRSGLRRLFLQRLRGCPFEDLLSDEYFDLNYIRGLVARYESGETSPRAELSNLVALITLAMTGWY